MSNKKIDIDGLLAVPAWCFFIGLVIWVLNILGVLVTQQISMVSS